MKAIEIEITFEREVFDEECDFACFPTTYKGGTCACGRTVYTDDRHCPACGARLKFVPFKPIKTDLTDKQYIFLKNYTGMNAIEISNTTKKQAIEIIGKKVALWKLVNENAYNNDDWSAYDCPDQPF